MWRHDKTIVLTVTDNSEEDVLIANLIKMIFRYSDTSSQRWDEVNANKTFELSPSFEN